MPLYYVEEVFALNGKENSATDVDQSNNSITAIFWRKLNARALPQSEFIPRSATFSLSDVLRRSRATWADGLTIPLAKQQLTLLEDVDTEVQNEAAKYPNAAR